MSYIRLLDVALFILILSSDPKILIATSHLQQSHSKRIKIKKKKKQQNVWFPNYTVYS